ncbi:hypothetical protein PHIM7_280 [Sinorhizobium phage phiM7]|uniref:Uncharacterized protein n=2 Tax=Emdodecavirus TaxID=1980937 RepID=S5MDF8_9CAUD|nr:hypothetical protein AB690_gp229 [Sinorhizobium phage phiM12]YP_009601405.1 hypothetical protein FDH46_gp198 [Sinorhizobium phage phiM7]AGR47999.1 hypothetical protein SmphiM12_367 [Sinorhizobium phage phiM12]AKF12825.1 hypothetical protein PHIM7_280 [Sinorhizobium phage phiM7]AKF13185.1 hypothetical protein PHIM19_280 [Sinorhizobium phage phiM19]
MSEKISFEVDSLTYVVEFDNNEFFLYVDGTKAKTKIAEEVEFDGFDFFEESSQNVLKSSDLVKTKSPIKVFKNVLKFVEDMIGKHKPHFFYFAANEEKKISLYAMVAQQLSKKSGYYLQADAGSFYFYKQA